MRATPTRFDWVTIKACLRGQMIQTTDGSTILLLRISRRGLVEMLEPDADTAA